MKICPYTFVTNITGFFSGNEDDITKPPENLAEPDQAMERWRKWNALQESPEEGAVYARRGNQRKEIKDTDAVLYAYGHGGLRRVVERVTGLLDQSSLHPMTQAALKEYDSRIEDYQETVKPLRVLFESQYGKGTSYNFNKGKPNQAVPKFSKLDSLIQSLKQSKDKTVLKHVEEIEQRAKEKNQIFGKFLQEEYSASLGISPNFLLRKNDQQAEAKNISVQMGEQSVGALFAWQIFHQTSKIQMDTTRIPQCLSNKSENVCNVALDVLPRFFGLLENTGLDQSPLVVQTLHQQMIQTSSTIAKNCDFSEEDLKTYKEQLKILDLDTQEKCDYYRNLEIDQAPAPRKGAVCPFHHQQK